VVTLAVEPGERLAGIELHEHDPWAQSLACAGTCGAAAADSATTLVIGVFAVAAMAIQNVASRTLFAAHAPTTVMTGNVTQTVMDAVDVALGTDAAPARSRLHKLLPSVGGFAIGAIAGGLSFVRVGFWCLIAPLLAILCVAWLHRRAR
jgi:uncharacterized membrane protein YoaK (UPF0700 family)